MSALPAVEVFHLQGQHDQQTHAPRTRSRDKGTVRVQAPTKPSQRLVDAAEDMGALDGYKAIHNVAAGYDEVGAINDAFDMSTVREKWVRDASNAVAAASQQALIDDGFPEEFIVYRQGRPEGDAGVVSVSTRPLGYLEGQDQFVVPRSKVLTYGEALQRGTYAEDELQVDVADLRRQDELAAETFHLQGEHDQQSHAGGRSRTPDISDEDMVRDAFAAEFTTKNGQKVRSEIDSIRDGWSGDMTDVEGAIYAEDPITGEMTKVGEFRRTLYENGEIYNDELQVQPKYQGSGIGSAFLDYSERQLAEAGFHTINVDAVDVGQYAWAARGYRLQDFEVQSGTHRDWLELAVTQNAELGGKYTAEIDALARAWDEPGAEVYGADLVALDPAFSSVFLEGPSWSGIRSITAMRDEELAVQVFHLQGQHEQKDHGRRGGGRSALDASDLPVLTDEYGELMIESTGVDRIRQISYDYDGGSDVYEVVIVEDDDGTIAVDVNNLYGSDGTIEGEQALERYLNDNDIDDIRWDGERGTLHASHRAAIMAGDATPRQKLIVDVEDAYSGGFTVDGQEYTIGDVNVISRDGMTPVSAEVAGSIYDADGNEVGLFRRAVYEDGTVYNHSLSIDRNFQGQGIGTAFLEKTEGALQPEVMKLSAVNVGRYAWAARGYQLDTGNSSLAAATRDRWADSAREVIGRTVDPVVAERAEAVLRSWSDDLNSVYPSDLLAVDDRFRDVFLEGPSWDAVKRRDDGRALSASAGIEVFHLQGEHDQETHGNRAGAGAGEFTGTAAAETQRVLEKARRGADPSEFDGPVMHRGIAIDVSPELKARIDAQLYDGADPSRPEDFNRKLELGPEIVDDLLDFEGHQGIERTGGIGQSWTTRESVAESVSAGRGGMIVVKVTARPRKSDIKIQEVDTPDGRTQYVDSSGNPIEKGNETDLVGGEMEVRIHGQSPLEIIDVQIQSGNRWESVWGDERGFGAGADELYRQFPHLLDELAVEVFHLKGQHDQQNHAGGRGSGAVSGIPEPSAEELEWRRSTREVPFLPNPAAGFTSKRAVFRNDRWLLVHAEDGTALRIEGGVKTGTQERLDMVNALADAYDANPVKALDKWGEPIEPRITILDENDWDQGDRTVAYVMPGLDPAKFDIHSGMASSMGPRGREPYRILVNDNVDLWTEESLVDFRKAAMPELANTSPRAYIITHEYGHVRMALGDDNRTEVERIGGAVKNRGWMGMSEYGQSNQAESHAEAFAEWTLSGGQTTNKAARLYARDLGWPGAPALSERIEDPIAAAAGADDYLRQPIVCGDGPGGPYLTFAEETAPSVEQFHLQGQHDQQSHAGGRGSGLDKARLGEIYSGELKVTMPSGTVETFKIEADVYDPEDASIAARRGDQFMIQGNIVNAKGRVAGSFTRVIEEDGSVRNVNFAVDERFQGLGVGTAFLDQTEEALVEAGATQFKLQAAGSVGRMAWASRGYRIDPEDDVESITERWLESPGASVIQAQWGEGDPRHGQLDALRRSWADDRENVYPGDLLVIDRDFRGPLISGPSWYGIRDVPTTRREDLAVEVFHLQGQHDQKDHGRRTRSDGRDLWAIQGYSHGITAAAAVMTNAEGRWDTEGFDDDQAAIAASLLEDIQSRSVSERTFFSGHGYRPGLEVGGTVDIPLMSVTPQKSLADWYRSGHEGIIERHPMEAPIMKKILAPYGGTIDGFADAFGQDAADALVAATAARSYDQHRPTTLWEFESSQSIPLRDNERLVSGRYEIVGIRDSDTPGSWFRSPDDPTQFIEGRSRVVTLKFVEPLKIEDPSPPEARFSVETFHLQGEHDQQSHAGGRGGTVEAPTPEEFDEAYDVSDPVPIYDRMGIDQTIMRAADFSEGEHDASWAHAAYTLGGSEAMNKYLRGQELPVHFQDEHADDAEILKQAIADAEPTKHDLVVYRGLGRFPRGMEGERIQDNGFISTSLDRRVAETFGNVVEIRVPAGTKAIAGNWGEFEVILAPGTQFDVTEDGLDVV